MDGGRNSVAGESQQEPDMAVILYSPASPYSAKVRMAAAWCDIGIETRIVNTEDAPADLLKTNPLGKIPAMVTDEGDGLYDSRAITQHLNRLSKGALFPRNAQKRMAAERMEALADGICDALLAMVYERRFRPQEKIHQPWLDKQWSKVERALDHLDANLPRATARTDGGQIALRATLAYLDLRFADSNWRRGRAKLARWARRFDERFVQFGELLPRA